MVNPDKVDAAHNPNEGPRLTRRSIRSFVVRNGRITAAQTDALDRLLPRFGAEFSDTAADTAELFGRQAPLWLEIGFGNGDVLLHLASEHPEANVLGVEVHAAGIGHALIGIENQQLDNVRIIQHDAMEVLELMLKPASVERVMLLFPDPWHKKRHHKRRIVQPDFLNAVARVLEPGGILHCATDWADYATWMLEHIEADNRFINTAGRGQAAERPPWRPVTRFEKRGHRLGHGVSDLIFHRT